MEEGKRKKLNEGLSVSVTPETSFTEDDPESSLTFASVLDSTGYLK